MAYSTDWNKDYLQLKAVRAKFKQKVGIMTKLEQETMREAIDGMVRSVFPRVVQGARSELHDSVNAYNQALSKRDQARKGHINRLNSRSVSEETERFAMRVKAALNMPVDPIRKESVASRLFDLYQEAKQSGMMEKLVGFRDAVSSIPESAYPDSERMPVSILVRSICNDTEASIQSPEVAAAEKELEDARYGVLVAKTKLKEYAKELDEPDPAGVFAYGAFTALYRTVEITSDGGVKVYDDNSPEVTGVREISKQDSIAVGGE